MSEPSSGSGQSLKSNAMGWASSFWAWRWVSRAMARWEWRSWLVMEARRRRDAGRWRLWCELVKASETLVDVEGGVEFGEFGEEFGGDVVLDVHGRGSEKVHPALLLKVWLYAYALGMTSSRRLEQRIREHLAFRYLAGAAQPDFWTLNEFRKRHRRAMNDIFTQVVELARSLGLGKLGHVAIDSKRIAANASRSATDSLEKLRAER